jgi:hypothetical protein
MPDSNPESGLQLRETRDTKQTPFRRETATILCYAKHNPTSKFFGKESRSDGLKTKERFFTAFRMTKRMPDRTPVEKNSRDSISAYGSIQSG